MIAALRAEFLKLRTLRSTWWSFGGMASIGVLGMVLGDKPVGAWQQYSRLGGVYLGGRIAVAMFAVMFVTSEFRSGAMQTSALAVPRRWTLHISKMVTTAVYSGLLALAGCGAAFLAAYVRTGSAQLGFFSSTAASTDGYNLLREHLPPVAFMVLVMLGFGLFSGAIAMALRSQPFAITVAAVGPVVGLLWNSTRNPFLLADRAVSPEQHLIKNELISRGSALAGFAAFAVLVALLAGIVHARRDI